MDLHDIRDLVASLFIMLNQKTYILFRVEFLVAVVTVLFLAMFIMDTFRRIFHSTIMKAIFSLFDGISDSVLIYLMGAMQAAPFKNGLFPVWALVLIIFRCGVDFISGYGVFDSRGRRFVELSIVINLVAAAFLNWRHGSRFQRPLWSLFALQCLRSLYRFGSHREACGRIWLGWSSELMSEYMRDPSEWEPRECKPKTMEGYRYLVFGERVRIQKPRYVLCVQNDDHRTSSLITLDRIWRSCDKHLPRHSHDLKDLSLAFALSRLLRCRLEGVNLQRNIRHINRNLVRTRIIEEKDDKRAFGIVERQLGFVNDYFNTRYPLVFCFGLVSLFLSLLQSIVTVALVCWLSVAIRKIYKPPDGELAHVVKGFNVDMVITWVFMFLVMFKETWEMVAYLLSDWTRLLLVCMYARQEEERARNCMERLISSFFRSKINAKTWHGHLDQYVFLQSFDDIPWFWNLAHIITTGMIPKKDEGAKLGSAIDVPEYVKPAIMEKLSALLDLDEPAAGSHQGPPEPPSAADARGGYFEDTDGRRLPKVLTTLFDNSGSGSRVERYGWACFDQQTSSHVILVWHVATNLCEMALAMEHGVDLSKPGFCRSLVSWFRDCCCSTKPYLVDVGEHKEKHRETNPGFLCSLLSCLTGCFSSKSNDDKKDRKLTEELRKKYIIASSLSNYCAYLLVSKPDLIPDSFLVPKMVFQETVRSARVILKGCDWPESRFNKLMKVAAEAEAENAVQDVKGGDDVLKQGAMLAKELLHHEKSTEGRWEILAGVWTELLIHMAPTWNADAHRTCLESGGEFITNIWALLWHCNVEESSLWPDYDAASEDDDAPAAPAPQDCGVGGSSNVINPVKKETQQAVAVADASNNDKNTRGIDDHEEEDGICLWK
jgi:hypothetical protein